MSEMSGRRARRALQVVTRAPKKNPTTSAKRKHQSITKTTFEGVPEAAKQVNDIDNA